METANESRFPPSAGGRPADLAARFGIASYQEQAVQYLLDHTSLRGLRVLEVGGSNLPRQLVLDELGAREWVCIDIIGQGRYQLQQQSAHYAEVGIHPITEAPQLIGTKDYLIFDGQIENAATVAGGYFDAVISITSFEHILALPAAMQVICTLKSKSAPFFTYHGPIWSGRHGHHVWVDAELNFNMPGCIEPFSHLLDSPPAMFSKLRSKYGDRRAQQAVLQMYHEPRINRLFYEDYVEYFRQYLTEVDVSPYFKQPIPDILRSNLERRHPGYKQFEAYGMTAFGH
jgi:hypothetical protein